MARNWKISELDIVSVKDVASNNKAALMVQGGAYIAKSLKVGTTIFVPTLEVSNIECDTITVNVKAYISGECVVNDLSDNVFIGTDTGYLSADKGTGNVGVGYQSGKNLTGSNNICIGATAGLRLNGDNNICMGLSSGNNAIGEQNVYIGSETGYNLSGSYNVCIGNRAGYCTGVQNVNASIMIGAANTNNNLTTGQILIGSDRDGLDAELTNPALIFANFRDEDQVGASTDVKIFYQEMQITDLALDTTTGDINWYIGRKRRGPQFSGDTGNFELPNDVGTDFLKYNVGTGEITYHDGNSNLDVDTITVNVKAYISGECVVNDLSDNVFIGTDTGYLSADKGTGNVGIGTDALGSISGTNNVGIGPLAGLNVTADDSIFIGNNAGRDCHTSTRDIAIGVYAGRNIGNESQYNVALGNYAGYHSSGTNNICVGYEAGISLVGGENVYIGAYTGDNATGSHNIAIGNNVAGGLGTSGFCGDYNTFIGQENNGDLSIGDENVAIGRNAGRTVSGDKNIVIGLNCGQSCQGNNNIYMGEQAGVGLEGSNNIIMGRNSGEYLTGSNNIIIGESCVVANNEVSNSVYMGFTGSHNTLTDGQVLIGTDISQEDVGITHPSMVIAGQANSGRLNYYEMIYAVNDSTINWHIGKWRNPGVTYNQNYDLWEPGDAGITVGPTKPLVYHEGDIFQDTSSSRRYKTNITNISNTDWIYELQPKQFNFKKALNRLNYGFIAEEIDDIDVDETHSVVGRKTIEGESVPDFVRMDNLIPFMVAEMKKMKARIDELESEVEELKNS